MLGYIADTPTAVLTSRIDCKRRLKRLPKSRLESLPLSVEDKLVQLVFS